MYWLFHDRIYLVLEGWKIIHKQGAKIVLMQLFYYGQNYAECMVGGTQLFEGAHLAGGNTRFFLESGRCSDYVFFLLKCAPFKQLIRIKCAPWNMEEKYKYFIFGHGSH